MIGEHEAAIHAAPTASAAQHHPAAGEGIGIVTETTHPGAATSRRRGQDDGLLLAWICLFQVAGIERGWQVDTGITVDPVQRLDRAMHHDASDSFIETVENPLCLAEGVAEQHAGTAYSGVGAPPVIDVAKHFALRGPAIDRQAEGGFSDKGMAAHGLEGGAGAVWLDLVVTGSHPDLTAIFQTHLRRAEHVPCGMKAEPYPVMLDGLAIGQRLQRHIRRDT